MHFTRIAQRVLAEMSRQDVVSVDTRLRDDMRAQAEACVIYSTWPLERGKKARAVVIRITHKAMQRFRSVENAQRGEMSTNFVSNLQKYILDEQYDVSDVSPMPFTIVVDELFLLERR